MNSFHYTSYAQEIIFGAGSLIKINEAADRFRWHRLMLCTTGSLRRSGDIAKVETALGNRLMAIFERVQPHVPDFQVSEALALAVENEIDAVIGMGGGSSIGMAKALSFALEEKRTGTPRAAGAPHPSVQPLVPVIAIPTTYAGSEMTPVYGITHHTDGTARKITVTDPRVTPKLTIYDPLLTLNLPPEMTAATGINALAHCIEAAYSITRNPLSTAAALSGAHHIYRALPRCYANGADQDARTEMLIGSYLAGSALSNVAMGLHHGICHILGGTAGVPHGIANSIMLPHVMRFNLNFTAQQLSEIAEAMGLVRNGQSDAALAEAGAQRVYELIGAMNLPQHLRDVGVKESDLPRLAEMALPSRTIQNNPKPITTAAQIEAVLRAAW